MALITFEDLPSTNTPINSTNLNNNFEYLDEKTETYSTTEVKTNKRWIDGKPIYRKVLSSTTSQTFSSRTASITLGNVPNIDTVVYFKVLGSIGGATDYVMDYTNNSTWAANNFSLNYANTFYCDVRKSTGNIIIHRQAGSSLDATTTLNYYSVIIEYTKTTN